MTHVFINYSRKVTEFVEKLEHELNARGIITWRDVHSIPGGTCKELRSSAQYPNVSANQSDCLCRTFPTSYSAWFSS